ncbi:MAG TPA: carboxypeptidase-like regulatory domain-containing protein [Longimicrobiaceae bacterium]|nr:carboxypeptidase-like regulatory domain-containing protein [Longimicrobiaceae bacterium]
MRVLLLLCILVAGALPLPSQTTPPPTLTVSGEVLDVFTGAPLQDAVIRLPDAGRSAVTDAQGRFTLRDIPPGNQKWVVGRLGYATWEQELEAEDGAEYTVRLLPRPEVLEGITVVVDRFETRRRATTTSVFALDRRQILSSASGNALDLVRTHGQVQLRRCSAEDPDHAPRCALIRGRLEPVQVCIDDRPALGGPEELLTYLPQEVYLVETYAGGAMVRVYTTWYVERLARNQRQLPPIAAC